MRDLKVFRQRNNFFMGREGVITVRDLIKWGKRDVGRVEDLAIEGYVLLAERLRNGKKKKKLKGREKGESQLYNYLFYFFRLREGVCKKDNRITLQGDSKD